MTTNWQQDLEKARAELAQVREDIEKVKSRIIVTPSALGGLYQREDRLKRCVRAMEDALQCASDAKTATLDERIVRRDNAGGWVVVSGITLRYFVTQQEARDFVSTLDGGAL